MTYTSTSYLDNVSGNIIAQESGTNRWQDKSSWTTMTWNAGYSNPMIWYTEPITVDMNYYNLNVDTYANGKITYHVIECDNETFMTGYDRTPLGAYTTGTISTSTSTTKFGAASVSFPGNTSSYFTLTGADNISTSTFTFEAWVYITSPLNINVPLFQRRDDANHGIELYSIPIVNGYDVGIRVNDGSLGSGSWSLALGPVTTSTWHHVAFTINANKEYRGFVDGHCYGIVTATQNLILSTSTAYVGATSDGKLFGNPAYFKGYMDDIRISNSCLYEGAFDTTVFTPPTSASTSTSTTVFLCKADEGIKDYPNIVSQVVEHTISEGDTNIPAFSKPYVMIGIEVESAERGVIYSSKITPNNKRLDILKNDVDTTTLTQVTTASNSSRILDLGRDFSRILAVNVMKTSGLEDTGVIPIVDDKQTPSIAWIKATEGSLDYVYGSSTAALDPTTLANPTVDVMVHILPEQYMANGKIQTR